jgi:subtilisin
MYQLISALLLVVLIGQAASEAETGTSSTESDEKSQVLIGKARRDGSVRIIVNLKTDFVPEGQLPDRGAAQRKTIADLQTSLLGRLEGCSVGSVSRFAHTPTLSLEADECALIRLIDAPEVANLTEDVPMPPARSSRH